MEPLDETLLKILLSLPEKWAEYEWADFTGTEQKALEQLVAAGLVEEKISLRCKMAGFKETVQFQIYRRGDYTKKQEKQAIFNAMPEEWLDTEGRTKGRYECEIQNSFQARLTDQGALAKHDYESEEPSFVLPLAKTSRERGVVRICAGLNRVKDDSRNRSETGQETKTGEEPYSNYSSSPAIMRHEHCIKQSKNGVEAEGSVLTMPVRSSKDNWDAIRNEYDISKRDFGKKINFVSDPFKRKIIFRDVEHAFVLASQGFSKSAVILAGGVIEELLRMYLKHKKIKPKDKRFGEYIKACEDNKLLKHGVSRLTDSIRDFRNLVHIEKEKEKRYTISKATAKGAVASIFTIANDFQKVS